MYIPYGFLITVSIDPAAVLDGYSLMTESFTMVQMPAGPPDEPLPRGTFFALGLLENPGEEAPSAESPINAPTLNDSPEADDAGEAVAAEMTNAQGVEAVLSLPNTGTQSVASEATGMVHLLIAATALMMAGVFGLRRRTG